jgi:P-type E1-E2 ATPase
VTALLPDQPGLTEEEAARRLAGRAPAPRSASSRSYASIVRANVLTVFNAILAFFGGLTLAFGSPQDALFLGVLVGNSTIGIVQEVRAKRALDRLSALVAPTASVVRDGTSRPVPREELVVDDLVALQPGDQLVGDGRLVADEGLLLDESILTGESEPVRHHAGDELRSGSFVAEGTGRYVVTAVGAASYAAQVTGEARAFRHPRSPLERAMNRLLYALVAAMLPLGSLLGYALWERQEPVGDAVSTAVAAVVTLVPEGLMLLLSLTFAMSAVRMAGKGALAQQLNAIESLASVDVVCVDKTGTLTEARSRVVDVVPAPGREQELEQALGAVAASASSRNATLQAVADRFPAPASTVEQEVPFSSRLRWSAVRLSGRTYVLGAPEQLPVGALAGRAEAEARAGRRVVALLSTEQPLAGQQLPDGLAPVGLVVLAESLRPNARATVEFFADQGVDVVVLSGDRPETVAAIAADVGIRIGAGALDGRSLPDDDEELRALLRDHRVVGRIAPEGKRRVVQALAADGRYVAMVGDGVNDVPGLKAARLAIAQGSGVQMARSVADLVLVKGDFSVVPELVAEGRRILRNLLRVTKLFVSKSTVAAFLILVIGISPAEYPLLPRHLTLVASLGVGIPSFFLALAPSRGRVVFEHFLTGVTHFAVPAGVGVGFGVVASFLSALEVFDLSLVQARTVATSVMLLLCLYLIVVLEAAGRRRSTAVVTLVLLLAAAYVAVLVLPTTRSFFAVAAPDLAMALIVAGGCAVSVGGLMLSSDQYFPGHAHDPGGEG